MSNQSFAEKYRPKKYSNIIGQDIAINAIKEFIQQYPEKKALVLYGPPGTGKTSIVHAAAKENNLEILELNSSDLRNRKKLEETLKPATLQRSLFKKGKILLMDEVDGVTGTDIGGVPELVRIIAVAKFPIIMTCNDIWQSKLAPIRTKAKLVQLKPLDLGAIISILSKVAEAEGIKKDPLFLKKISIKSQGDLRAAMNDLQAYAQGEDISIDTSEKRDVEDSIYNIMKRIFKEKNSFLELFDTTSMSLDEIFLWIEENIPKEYKNESLAKAYYALGNADVFRGRIYMNQSWRFLIYQNIFQSAGISLAKPSPIPGFTKYDRPKRILKIWLHNQKTQQKKTIAKKYAKIVHSSIKQVLRDFNLIKPIMQIPSVQNQLKLSEEEIDFLKK